MNSTFFLSPGTTLLLLVLILLFVFVIGNFIIFYHLVRFGIGTQPKKIAAFFILGLTGLFFVSVFCFASIDMTATKEGLAKISSQISNNHYLTTPSL